jgi:hypothetical protein
MTLPSRTRRRKSSDQVLNDKEGRRRSGSKKSNRNSNKANIRQLDYDNINGLEVDDDLYDMD